MQDVGLSELRACRSLLRQALVHLLKLRGWPGSQAAPHWRGETVGFVVVARDRFTPSMRQQIDVQDLYANAVIEVEAGAEPTEPRPGFAKTCPLPLDDLLAERPDIGILVAKL